MSDRRPVKRVIVVAASPRTGSTLLSEAITATGAAGRTHEYLNPRMLLEDRYGIGPVRYTLRGHAGRLRRRVGRSATWDRPVPERFSTASVVSAVQRIEERFLSPDGVLSMKVMWGDFDQVMLSRGLDVSFWEAPVSWVWIRREDRVRQAVSWSRALQTNHWHSHPESVEISPSYDGALIESCVKMGDRDEAGWRRHFANRGISPYAVTYEELDADYDATMGGVFRHLQLDAARTPPPQLPRMADELSEQWVRRYRNEHSA